jgi:hypothetical protein
LLAGVWVWRDLRSGQPPPTISWAKTNTTLLTISLAVLPLQYYLLRFGPPHDTTDAIGVFLTIAQWLLINIALARRGGAVRNFSRASTQSQDAVR